MGFEALWSFGFEDLKIWFLSIPKNYSFSNLSTNKRFWGLISVAQMLMTLRFWIFLLSLGIFFNIFWPFIYVLGHLHCLSFFKKNLYFVRIMFSNCQTQNSILSYLVYNFEVYNTINYFRVFTLNFKDDFVRNFFRLLMVVFALFFCQFLKNIRALLITFIFLLSLFVRTFHIFNSNPPLPLFCCDFSRK